MKFKQILALLASCLIVVSCSKSGDSSAGPAKVDLGIVNVNYAAPVKENVPDGRSCVITASPFPGGNCGLVVELQKAGKTIESRHQIPAQLDKPAIFDFENLEVTVTPHLAQ